MPVAVFGRLQPLLQQQNLTIAELRRQIELLYGVNVDSEMLDHLAGGEELRQIDLTVVGAVASFLNVSLDNLLDVISIPASMLTPSTDPDFLTEEEGRRLSELFDRQDAGLLTDEEQSELESLVYDTYGQRMNDYYRRKEAQRRGVSIEQVQREEDERIAEAMKYHGWLEADPRRINFCTSRA